MAQVNWKGKNNTKSKKGGKWRQLCSTGEGGPSGQMGLRVIFLYSECESHSVVSYSWICVTPRTIQSLDFPKPEYWSGKSFPSPGDLPNRGVKPRSPALQEGSLPSELWGKSHDSYRFLKIHNHWPDKPKLHQFKGNKKPLTWTFPEKLQKIRIPCLLCTSLPKHHLWPLEYEPHFLVLPYRPLPQKGEHQEEEGRLFTSSS